MELQDERTLLLSNFNYPSPVYVNVDNKKEFRVLNKTIIGDVDLRRYGLVSVVWNRHIGFSESNYSLISLLGKHQCIRRRK